MPAASEGVQTEVTDMNKNNPLPLLVAAIFLVTTVLSGVFSPAFVVAAQSQAPVETTIESPVQTEFLDADPSAFESLITPEVSFELTPELTLDLLSEPTPEQTSGLASGPTLEVNPELTPDLTSGAMSEGSPETTPVHTLEHEVLLDAIPVITIEPVLENTPEPTIDLTPDLTLEATSEPTAEGTPVHTPEDVLMLEAIPVITIEPMLENTPEPTIEPTPEATPHPSLWVAEVQPPSCTVEEGINNDFCYLFYGRYFKTSMTPWVNNQQTHTAVPQDGYYWAATIEFDGVNYGGTNLPITFTVYDEGSVKVINPPSPTIEYINGETRAYLVLPKVDGARFCRRNLPDWAFHAQRRHRNT